MTSINQASIASASATTIDRLVDLLDEPAEDDYGDASPTQHAFRSAYRFIEKAEKQLAVKVLGSASVDSLGGIRVTWKKKGREIRLVVPHANAEQPYIYEQSSRNYNAIHQITPDVLAGKLSWLVFGGGL